MGPADRILPPPPYPSSSGDPESPARIEDLGRGGPRPLPPTTSRRGTPSKLTVVAIGIGIALAGLSLAIVATATPGYVFSTLAASGSFFALAESGGTVYAASENGGSILLERSADYGIHWTASPVPYAAVAGGAPWAHAAVAVDGSRIVLAAATVGYSSGPPPPYPIPYPPGASYNCRLASTVLAAASADSGLTWKVQQLVTPGASVDSLQAAVVGGSAAVGWLAEAAQCGSPSSGVGAITSADGGLHWTAIQSLNPTNETPVAGTGLEMAASAHGLVAGFAASTDGGGSQNLSLWILPPGPDGPFQPLTELPAPASWTLQGDPYGPPYLVTPSYLIPLGQAPYTALPFNQLEIDGGALGVLPRVVSLVSTGPASVEIAATTSDRMGVDCWSIDLTSVRVGQSCHVELRTLLRPSSDIPPIVALIDRGGGWVAVGAADGACGGTCPAGGCPPACPPGGFAGNGSGPPPPGAASAPAAVGTSVCVTGCSSAQGLAAYSFSPENGAPQDNARVLGGLMIIVGFGLAAAAYLLPGRRAPGAKPSLHPRPPSPDGSDPPPARIGVLRWYRLVPIVWALSWAPLVAIVATGGGDGADPSWPIWILVGGVGGGIATLAISVWVRASLLRGSLPPWEEWGRADWKAPEKSISPGMPAVAARAHASWVVGALAVVVVVLSAATAAPPAPGGGVPPGSPGPVAYAAIALLLIFGALRTAYHRGLAREIEYASPEAEPRDARLRGWLQLFGAVLWPWNPMTGALLGLALQGAYPSVPFLLPLALLPVTLLGGALILLSARVPESAWGRLATGGAAPTPVG